MEFKRTPASAIQTPRLRLRRFDQSHQAPLYAAVRSSSQALSPFLPWCHANYKLSDAKAWIQFTEDTWDSKTQFAYFIEEQASGQLVGGCGLDSPTGLGDANLGYWVRTDKTRQGYASEAAAALAAVGLDQLALKQVKLTMSVHNLASRQVAIRLGATFRYIAERHLELNGLSHDAFVYTLEAPRLDALA